MAETPNQNLSLLALGGGGGNIARVLADSYAARWVQIAHLDTDVRDLDFVNGVLQVPLGQERSREQGCGDDPLLGRHAAEASIGAIRDAIGQAKMLLVVTCLGGGLGSGAAVTIARLAKEMDLLSFFLVSLPLAGEGNGPRQIAEEALRQLRNDADVLVTVPNDLLFKQLPADTGTLQAFEMANRVFADSLTGLAEITRCRGVIPIDFSTLKTVLRGRDAHCSIGIGRASGANRATEVVDALFASPLLGGDDHVSKANAVVGTLVGGEDLSIGDLNACLAAVNERLNPNTRGILGANLVEGFGDELQLTLLAVHDQRQRRPGGPNGHTGTNAANDLDGTRQIKLPLFAEDTGALGIFGKTEPTTYEGQNLDIPTFQRRNITIDPDVP